MISIQVDTRQATRWLNDLQRKQIPFATALALTRTAKLVEKRLQLEMSAGLQASPYTRRSTFSTSAKKTNLQAIFGLKDKKPAGGTAPSVLLKEHFGGGLRGNKPMEKAVIAMGLMPSGWRMVPGAGLSLDAYGNPRRNQVREIIGALRSGMQIHKGRGKSVAAVGYFVIRAGAQSHLGPGIYWRKGRAIRPMFLFVDAAGYRKRFDLPQIGKAVVDEVFADQLRSALDTAISSAR